MGANTKIDWCDSTINPTSGCDGCELFRPAAPETATCYAKGLHEGRLARTLPDKYDADFKNVRLIPGRMKQAASWSDLRGKDRPDKPWLNGMPRMIFVGDMGDFLSRDVPDSYVIEEILGGMVDKHFYLLLTKRPERLALISKRVGGLPDNCMAMTTATNQRTADVRIPALLQVKSKWKGLSLEPLRDQLSIASAIGEPTVNWGELIQWVIVGGESGSLARPMDPDWARKLRDECLGAETAYFFKQWGEYRPAVGRENDYGLENCSIAPDSGIGMWRAGKKSSGRELDDVEHSDVPLVA